MGGTRVNDSSSNRCTARVIAARARLLLISQRNFRESSDRLSRVDSHFAGRLILYPRTVVIARVVSN